MDEIIKFASYLTGHDEETIKQMYRDWQSSPNVKANPLDCEVSDAKGRKIKGIQILAYEINTLSGDIDVAYCKKFKEMTIDFIGGDNTILTKKDLEALLSR